MADYCQHCGSVLDRDYSDRVFGDLSIQHGAREIWREDQHTQITPTESDLFFDLMSGKPLSREAAVMRYAKDEETNPKTYDVLICRMRAKLKQLNSNCEIVVLSRLGWQLVYHEPKFEERHFGDFTLDLDRRLLLKGKALAPLNPATIRLLEMLMSGDLEPTENLLQLVDGKTPVNKKANLRQQIQFARKAIAAVSSTVEIINFEKRGYQMRSGSKGA